MSDIYFDNVRSAQDRRSGLYDGDIFVYSPSDVTAKLCELAKHLINEAFAPHDPQTIDRHLSMEDCAAILAKLKPTFIHHPGCKRLLPEIICSLGEDREAVYFDVPRLRSAYPTTYLTSGIAYAFHPHRDTWYSAPKCQINWWLPIFDISSTNCLAFYPKYFHRAIQNNSEIYNYAEWNRRSRVEAAKHVKSDAREQPKPQEEVDVRRGPVAEKILRMPGSAVRASP
jgi:hypothetical protein